MTLYFTVRIQFEDCEAVSFLRPEFPSFPDAESCSLYRLASDWESSQLETW